MTENDWFEILTIVRRTHDAKSRSLTIEKNYMVNGIKGSTEVEREKESSEPVVNCMIYRIEDVNKKGFSRVMLAVG